MELAYGVEGLKKDNSSLITVGTFDGIHHGHQSIIRYLVDRAQRKGGTSVALSFDPHPRQVLTGEPVPMLTTIEERGALFEALGLDRFIVVPFTEAFAATSARDFVVALLVEQVGMQEIVIGYDHGFGKGREGNSDLLQQLGADYGFSVDVVPAQILEQGVVSSSRIRELLAVGEVGTAGRLLSRPYSLMGTVVHGDGRGKTIGYPTANIAVANPNKVVPKQGVYAVHVRVGDAPELHGAMMNVGVRPTFANPDKKPLQTLEIHIFDLDADLYGTRLTVDFVKRIRDEQKFNSIDALIKQLSKDEARCRAELKL
ncbi:MAG: bifunctional riboflavin kinase/FAD synthetase [Bacteroidota bacterium]